MFRGNAALEFSTMEIKEIFKETKDFLLVFAGTVAGTLGENRRFNRKK